MIKETSTCSYLMIIYTPRLCNDVAFLPPQENLAHAISCKPVIPESDVDAWTLARLEEKAKEADRLVAFENENPFREMVDGAEGSSRRKPIIGGIEVGAKSLVGTEGKVIEKSVVVGGGKETFVGTVASSSGHQMSKEEMKRLKIADPQDVEKLKRNLQKLAGRKGWKLDLVDTPRGREFRGIIEADEEEEEDKSKSKDDRESRDKDTEDPRDGAMDRADLAEYEDEGPQEGSEEVFKDEL
jgi:protein OS-9